MEIDTSRHTSQSTKTDPRDASRVHGIYDQDVRSKPVFKECANELAELMEGAVIVGHNARKFDMPLLQNEFYRCGISPPKPLFVLTPWRQLGG